jgi:mediator of RNA polymerase II transcription subunit 17
MAGIPVRIEPPAENTVMEVTYDGQEVVQPPLTMSENLSRLARKIDFVQDGEMMEVVEEEEEDEEEGEEGGAAEEGDEDSLKSFHQTGQTEAAVHDLSSEPGP